MDYKQISEHFSLILSIFDIFHQFSEKNRWICKIFTFPPIGELWVRTIFFSKFKVYIYIKKMVPVFKNVYYRNVNILQILYQFYSNVFNVHICIDFSVFMSHFLIVGSVCRNISDSSSQHIPKLISWIKKVIL